MDEAGPRQAGGRAPTADQDAQAAAAAPQAAEATEEEVMHPTGFGTQTPASWPEPGSAPQRSPACVDVPAEPGHDHPFSRAGEPADARPAAHTRTPGVWGESRGRRFATPLRQATPVGSAEVSPAVGLAGP